MDKRIKLNVTFDLDEALDYYKTVQEKFHHLKWIPTENLKYIDERAIVKEVEMIEEKMPSGWAIQSFIEDNSQICPPWNVIKHNNIFVNDINYETELMFGFARKVLDKFPMAKRMGISEMKPNGFIQSHWDKSWRVHLPLISPDKSYFTWDDDQGNPIEWDNYPSDGGIWLLDTNLRHSVKNMGDANRVHIIFTVKNEDVEELLKIQGTI
jgi:hypothetical protein